MAEVQFAKSFLTALDARPVKLPADFVEDARSYPSRSPYTLPRMPKPMRKPAAAAAKRTPAPGQARSITVAVKSLHRNPPLDVRLSSPNFTLATTSLLDVRTALAAQTRVPASKLRLLHNKKPVADSKVLKDLVAADSEEGDASEIELGVMVMGGAATVAAAAAEATAAAAAVADTTSRADAAAPDSGGGNVAESEAFWTDLRGFLAQRTGDDKQADELFSLFLRAWEDRMV